jgi:hypothetical protein
MSINAFIPEVWAATLLESLKKLLVYGQPSVANRDYEGDIANYGDTVRITSISRPTIGNYVKGSTVIVPEQLTDAQRALVIDQSKYFAFEVDDIDMRQAVSGGALMDGAATEAAYGLRDVGDQFLAAFYTGVQSANNLGTISVTDAAPLDAYDKVLVPLKVALDNANVPDSNRYVVVPPWFHGRLLRDNRFVNAEKSGTTDALRNGFIGRATGFDILVSNNTPNPTGDDYVIQAGYPGALSFAEQINKVEAYRPQDSFSDALQGLHLYGGKLIRPDGIAIVTASQT